MPARKIALITNGYPDAGARERSFILPELKALLAYGHEVTLFPVRPTGRVDPALPTGVRIDQGLARLHRPGQEIINLLLLLGCRAFWREGRRSLRQGGWSHVWHFLRESVRMAAVMRLRATLAAYDVLYTYWFKGEATGVGLLPLSHVRRVTRAHGYDLYEERNNNNGYIPYRAQTLPLLDRVVLLSPEACGYLDQRHPGYRARMAISPLGVEGSDRSNPDPVTPAISLVSCSYATANKRVPLIGALAAALARHLPDRRVTWTHFGVSQAELAHGLDAAVPDNLHIHLPGEVPNDVVRHCYATEAVSLFINLSRSEGQPVSIMEAMAFGIPVVATAVGGVPDMIQHGGGLTLPVDVDVEAAAQQLANLLQDTARYQAMRAAARTTQRTYFNTCVNHLKLAELLGRV
ncbi:glycosyltransferase [Bordetella genomosp. 12]|uniref:Glycosyl transferase family 1 n=1 Tax=Bordetella genomosp. 12 TaxID=463035 RepID=A0A261VEI8_9BORD|nr:glycosyltransferase [Bordetella genomosp. 12]OZI72181.1 glycosyl transferase family 1 [Bordetella genomosp. 12]